MFLHRDTTGGTVFVLVPTGNPPSLRFGHPDVTFGRHRPSAHARLPEVARRVFRKRPQGVTRTLSDAERGKSGASG